MKCVFQEIVDLIETNIRQRGIRNPNPMKLGKCIKELERIYGISKGNNQHISLPNNSVSSQDDLAKELGVSVDTLQNYKKLTELVPELQDWVETGNVIVICVVHHDSIISCIYVYLACKSVYECWCRILG